MSQSLKIGSTYAIDDWCGMMGHEGTYLGIARDEANHGPDILVFSYLWSDDPIIRYTGCVVETYIEHGYDGKPDRVGITFRMTYYGDSVETLKHITARKPHEWSIRL